MKRFAPIITALALASPAFAQDEPAPVTPSSVIAAASAEEWIAIAPEDLLVMDLADDQWGRPRRVVIQLMPPPFSQPWVENIRTLARAHWWDGTSVNRVQDNYVTQWGDVTGEKPAPDGVVAPTTSYASTVSNPNAEIAHSANILRRDPVGSSTFMNGWPIAFENTWIHPVVDANTGESVAVNAEKPAWPIHCYGYVGVGRDYAPDTGTGAELYTIIGQPQRHMDRNLAVVGRVIEGMEHLSSLPRGSGELGFYTEEEAHLRTPIVSVRLASEITDAPRFEYLDTASESFARYVAVRANRDDAFYTVPAGGVDVCSVLVPVREIGSAE